MTSAPMVPAPVAAAKNRPPARGIRNVLSSEWTKFVFVVAAATAVHWLGGTSERMFDHAVHHGFEWNPYDPLILLVSAAILAALWLAWRYTRRHSGIVVHFKGVARFCPNLVLFLSPPLPAKLDKAEHPPFMDRLGQTRLDLLSEGWCPAHLCDSPWRMPLHAIAHHARLARLSGAELPRVFVIPSKQTRAQADLFKTLAENGLGREGLVDVLPRGVDFENFDDVSEAVNSVLEGIDRSADRRFLLDITGGSKMCSVVGAALSFEHGRRVQYVHGNLEYMVAEYDLGYFSPEYLKL